MGSAVPPTTDGTALTDYHYIARPTLFDTLGLACLGLQDRQGPPNARVRIDYQYYSVADAMAAIARSTGRARESASSLNVGTLTGHWPA